MNADYLLVGIFILYNYLIEKNNFDLGNKYITFEK